MDVDKGRTLRAWHCMLLSLPVLVFCLLSVSFNRFYIVIVFGLVPTLVAYLAITQEATSSATSAVALDCGVSVEAAEPTELSSGEAAELTELSSVEAGEESEADEDLAVPLEEELPPIGLVPTWAGVPVSAWVINSLPSAPGIGLPSAPHCVSGPCEANEVVLAEFEVTSTNEVEVSGCEAVEHLQPQAVEEDLEVVTVTEVATPTSSIIELGSPHAFASSPPRGQSWEDSSSDTKEDSMPQVPAPIPRLPFSCLPVFVHIYDVSQQASIQRINALFSHKFSPFRFGGLFHAGVEVDGQEWSFGFTSWGTGVHSAVPKKHPLHHYRETIVLDHTVLKSAQIKAVLDAMTLEYQGRMYHLVRKNCCHFAADLCQRLGAGQLPEWVTRFANIGESVLGVSQGLEENIRNIHLSRSVVPEAHQNRSVGQPQASGLENIVAKWQASVASL